MYAFDYTFMGCTVRARLWNASYVCGYVGNIKAELEYSTLTFLQSECQLSKHPLYIQQACLPAFVHQSPSVQAAGQLRSCVKWHMSLVDAPI